MGEEQTRSPRAPLLLSSVTWGKLVPLTCRDVLLCPCTLTSGATQELYQVPTPQLVSASVVPIVEVLRPVFPGKVCEHSAREGQRWEDTGASSSLGWT